jgi:hypothetical protein
MSFYEGAACKSEQLQAPVPSAVSELSAAIKNAHDAAAQLEGRLATVLENQPPNTTAVGGGAKLDRGPSCELHGQLQVSAAGVNELAARLYYITSRLAL